jgi:hypothetical protein
VGDTPPAAVFKETFRYYLDQVNRMAPAVLRDAESILGVRQTKCGIIIPFFRRQYRVASDGVFDEDGRQSIFPVSVVLCRYLMMCPAHPVHDGEEWVSYKDFLDAAPFAGAFNVNTEQAVVRNFSGRVKELSRACRSLGGHDPHDGLAYDLAENILALPRIPLYLLFNDADDEFPAQCRILFERRAEKFLDMECLAILGWMLSDYLMQACGKPHVTMI